MLDSAFLCLDIGTCGVRGVAHRIRNARIDKSAYYSVDDFDTVFALKSVIDELEKQIGRRSDTTCYITGIFAYHHKMTTGHPIIKLLYQISRLNLQELNRPTIISQCI